MNQHSVEVYAHGELNSGVEWADGVEEVVRLAGEFASDEAPAARDWLVSHVRELIESWRTVSVNDPEQNIEPFFQYLTERHPDLIVGLRGMSNENFSHLWICWYTGGRRYDTDEGATAAWKQGAARRGGADNKHEPRT